MKIKISDKELFKKILCVNHTHKPKIIDFSFDGKEFLIEFDLKKKYDKKEKELIEAGYAKFGLYFSSDELFFPDLMDEPKEFKVSNSSDYNIFFWEETFPKKWSDFFSKPLFLFVPDKGVKGFSTISKYFQIEGILRGKKILYFNFKDFREKSFENFLKIKNDKDYDLYIFDHIGISPQDSFEKFLFFLLKAPWEKYEIVATQWPGRVIPQTNFLDIPSFSFSEILKMFFFPEIEKGKFLSLMEKYISEYGYFPANLVKALLKNMGIYEEKKKEKREFFGKFEKEKIEKKLKKGKLFDAYPFYKEIKSSKGLYSYMLAWQGDWETLLLILEKPNEDIYPVLFFLCWDGFLEPEKLKNFLPEDIYFLLKDRKKNFIKKLVGLIDKYEFLSFYLKLIYADKLFSSGMLEEGEKIFEDLKKGKAEKDDFKLAQLNRYLSYYNFYKGKLEDSINNIFKWMEISSQNGWLWQMTLAYNDLGVILTERKDLERARDSFLTALNFSFFLSEERKQNVNLFNLAVVYSYIEKFEKAKEIFKKLEKLHRESGDIYSLIFDLYELLRINYLVGDFENVSIILKDLENLIKDFPNHPRFFQILILKTKVLVWFSKDEYKNSLLFLKNLKNFPIHLESERKILLSQGTLRGVIDFNIFDEKEIELEKKIKIGKLSELSFEINSIEDAIKIMEWKLFYPENLPAKFLKDCLQYLEKKGFIEWKNKIFNENQSIQIPIFEIFKEREVDLGKIKFPFRIDLNGSTILEKGEKEGLIKIQIPEDIVLFIPDYLKNLYSKETWYAWVYSLIYKVKESTEYMEKIPSGLENFNGFYYCSHKMKKIIEKAKKIAKKEIPLHIFGETGTGKEILAKAIHQESNRFFGPFIPVNCSAIPENLFESEFLGWKKGAFTGALMDRPGYFEQADRGTLFLDEIGEMPLNLQAKLLRVLQEKEVQRLGDFKRKKVDFRLITATNKDLKKLMEEGKFREDLFFRIVVGSIYLPPLRERREEIIPLSNFIILKNLKNLDIKNFKIDPLFLKGLEKKEWAGNIRELENYIISSLINLEEGGSLSFEDKTHQNWEETQKFKGNYHQILRDFKKELIGEALKKTKNNRREAAKLLGITPQALGYLLKELKMVK